MQAAILNRGPELCTILTCCLDFCQCVPGFVFSENEPSALEQFEGGPCAVLAPVQVGHRHTLIDIDSLVERKQCTLQVGATDELSAQKGLYCVRLILVHDQWWDRVVGYILSLCFFQAFLLKTILFNRDSSNWSRLTGWCSPLSLCLHPSPLCNQNRVFNSVGVRL